MPFESSIQSVSERVVLLNHKYRHHAALPVLTDAFKDPIVGRIGLVSSFGAESVVLLHMISLIDRTTPVLFIDTQMLFAETLDYQHELAERLKLTNIRIVTAAEAGLAARDPNNLLHKSDPNACCALRKSEPLELALSGLDAWITGRKRFQSGTRAALELFEVDTSQRLKINPLAYWRPKDVSDYIANNGLPRHPLVTRDYPSIGCVPCTSRVQAGEDARAGRWRGQEKTECGIHFKGGAAQRSKQ